MFLRIIGVQSKHFSGSFRKIDDLFYCELVSTGQFVPGGIMSFLWQFNSIPELQPLSTREQKEVWAATAPRAFKDPVVLVTMLACAILGGLGGATGPRLLHSWVGIPLGVLIGGGIGYMLYWQVAVSRLRPHLAAEIQARKRK